MVSIRPSSMVEGGAVPIDRNLLWRECRFALFNYTKSDGTVVATTTAARITYDDDGGAEYVQHYSVADPQRFIPSQDGKTLVSVSGADAVSKSSNFHLLMSSLVNAGFPENRLSEDISVLDGLYTYNIGIPEPKRSGLTREPRAEGARERIISVPNQVLRLPGEKAKPGAKPSAVAKKGVVAPPEAEGDEDATEAALAFVGGVVAEAGTIKRQELAVRVFRDLAKDPNKDAIARLVFQPEFSATLLANGFKVNGEEITR